MTTSTFAAPVQVSQRRPVPIEVKFPKEPTLDSGEPELELMEQVVQVIVDLVEKSTKPAFAPDGFRSTAAGRREAEIVTQYLSGIVKQATTLFEEKGASWHPVRETPYYALYVFALFRFGLGMKHLTALSSRLISEGELPSECIRSLCNTQARDARRHAPHSASTTLANLGLDSRYWR